MEKDYRLGDNKITASVEQKGPLGFTYINLHNNEETSLLAAKEVITSGIIISLKHGDKPERNITFSINGTSYIFDPNRIFSDAGIEKTLKDLSSYSKDAATKIKTFADNIIVDFSLLKPQGGIIIALHNNYADGDYSISSYLPGGNEHRATKTIYISPHWHTDDFFVVTTEQLFDYFKSNDFNVVLQDNENAPDDGSLSVFCGKKNIPYINIEAQHGHIEEQKTMIEAVLGCRKIA